MPDQPGVQPDRIDVNSEEQLSLWATKLNVTAMQLRDAVGVAGDKASDVELHLKGTRSTTNDDRVEELGS